MTTATYTFRVHLDDTPEAVDPRVRTALKDQGFGILSEIDVEAALREKLGEEIGHYTILGACNPPLAHRAIGDDPDIGALLPCNVVIRAGRDGGTDVVAIDPERMLDVAGSQGVLEEVASEARERIERALATLS